MQLAQANPGGIAADFNLPLGNPSQTAYNPGDLGGNIWQRKTIGSFDCTSLHAKVPLVKCTNDPSSCCILDSGVQVLSTDAYRADTQTVFQNYQEIQYNRGVCPEGSLLSGIVTGLQSNQIKCSRTNQPLNSRYVGLCQQQDEGVCGITWTSPISTDNIGTKRPAGFFANQFLCCKSQTTQAGS